MQELKLKRVYRHFKGDYYLVEGLAHDSESGVPCGIYRKLYGDGGLWVRPLEMFLSRVDREKYPIYRKLYGDGSLWIRPTAMFLGEVDHEKYPDCAQKYRFELQDIKSRAGN